MELSNEPICLVPFTAGIVSLSTLSYVLESPYRPLLLYIDNLFPHNHNEEKKCVWAFVYALRDYFGEHLWTLPPSSRSSESPTWNIIVQSLTAKEQTSLSEATVRFEMLARKVINICDQNPQIKYIAWNIPHYDIRLKDPDIQLLLPPPSACKTHLERISRFYNRNRHKPCHFSLTFDFWAFVTCCKKPLERWLTESNNSRYLPQICGSCSRCSEVLKQYKMIFE